MGLLRNQLFDGMLLRILIVVEQLSRESPLIEVNCSVSGQKKVAPTLDRRLADGPVPIALTVDLWHRVHRKVARGMSEATPHKGRLHARAEAVG